MSKIDIRLTLCLILNPLSANNTKWSNTLKQFFGKQPMNFLSAFDRFARLVFKGLEVVQVMVYYYSFSQILD